MRKLRDIVQTTPTFVVACDDQYDRAKLLTALGKIDIKTEGSIYATELNVLVTQTSDNEHNARCVDNDLLFRLIEKHAFEVTTVMFTDIDFEEDTHNPPLTC